MRNHLVRTSISAIAIVGALSLGASGAEAQKKILRADTGSPGAVSHAVIVVLGKVWQKELGITIQINDSQTLTRSAMKLGRGQLEIMPFPTSIYEFMSKGSRMYKKKLHNEAIAASKNVRSIWGWQAVVFHPVTFDIAGITELNDGKTPKSVHVTATKDSGETVEFDAKVRIDTPGEADYYRNGGILQYVLRGMLKS